VGLRFDKAFARDALVLGATALISGYYGQLVFTVIRLTLARVGGEALGASYNGNFQAASTIGTTYFTLVLGSLGNFFLPRFAAAADAEELTSHVRRAEAFVLRVAPSVLLVAVLFRRDVIGLLYSDRFEIATSILGFTLAGDLLRAMSWTSAAPLLVRKQVRAFFVTETVGAILATGFNVPLIHLLGPQGAGVAYVATYAGYALFCAFVLKRTCGVAPNPRALTSALALTAVICGVEVATRVLPIARFFAAPIAVFWAWRAGAFEPVLQRFARLRGRLRAS
jgi:O-antigen/teichoic acid export membrane protein